MRLLALLSEEELTVAELTAITELPSPGLEPTSAGSGGGPGRRPPRIGVVVLRLDGFRRGDEGALGGRANGREDPLLVRDRARLGEVLGERGAWATRSRGDWSGTTRPAAPGVARRAGWSSRRLGDVLDVASGDGAVGRDPGATRAPDRVHRQERGGRREGAAPSRGLRERHGERSRHARPPSPDASFDTVLLLASLSFTDRPQTVIDEAARVLRPAGSLVVTTLGAHEHVEVGAATDTRTRGSSLAASIASRPHAASWSTTAALTSTERRARISNRHPLRPR